MRKTLYKLALVAVATACTCGCSDYLDRTPLDSNSDATNWTSESAIEVFSWKFYGYLSEMSYGSGSSRGQYHGETLTDDYATESFTEFTKQVPASSSAWNTPYDRIREANIMLNRIDIVPGLSQEVANHWRGVARFFRALYHFDLVKTYGDVVWIDSEIDFSKQENVSKARDSRVTVMDNVVADLEFAMNNCYDPSKASANTVNNMVAAALLSRAALYEAAWEKYHNVAGGHPDQFYTKAKTAADKVISSGLYEVTDNYKGMYTSLSLIGSKEVLLYKIYTKANVNGGKVDVAHSQIGWVISSTPTWGLTKSAVENYAMADGLPIGQSSFTFDDKTMAGTFENRDKRLLAAVDSDILPVANMPYTDGILSTTGYWTWKFVDWSKRTEYMNAGTWSMPANDTDGPIFQYSEVLENYAEACAELGQISQADLDKSVNLLRTKHGQIPPLTLSGTGCSVNGKVIAKVNGDPAANVLIQELRRDRRSELMADGFRHDDLMRWALGKNLDTKENPSGYVGASKQALQQYSTTYDFPVVNKEQTSWADVLKNNFFVTVSGVDYKSPYNTSAAGSDGSKVDRIWNDKYYLEPIPSGQSLLDPNLGQNKGW